MLVVWWNRLKEVWVVDFLIVGAYKMSVAMDRALMSLSLEEEDEPFAIQDLPGFCLNGKNHLSIVGRVLNPEC